MGRLRRRDVTVGKKLAYVLCGGDLSKGTWVDHVAHARPRTRGRYVVCRYGRNESPRHAHAADGQAATQLR